MKHGKMRCHSGSRNPPITGLDHRILDGLLSSQCCDRKDSGKTLDIGQTFRSVFAMRETVTVSMGSKIAKFVRTAARARRLTIPNYLKRLAREEMARVVPTDGDDAIITREEILRRLESADDPRNCIAHDSIESMIESLHERAS
ncbi:MAG: hypothetical protein LBI81_03245 [Puniceicoccales bacterium]|nr:hypothetical protein [Puniceicoccales bacterium]